MNQRRESDFIGGGLAIIIGFPLAVVLAVLISEYWFYILGAIFFLVGLYGFTASTLDSRRHTD